MPLYNSWGLRKKKKTQERYKPAQHCIRLCSEDGRIYNKSGVVHDERHSFGSSDIPSSLFAIFIHKHHFPPSLAAAIWAWLAAVPAAGAHADNRTIWGRLLGPGAAGPRWTVILLTIFSGHEVEGEKTGN